MLHTYIGGRSRKLGRSILTFSLPPILTCIGSTPHCREICYGVKGGQVLLTRVVKSYNRNLAATEKPNFVERMARAIENAMQSGEVKAFRIHVVGDFYSQAYLEKWKEIARRFPDLRFAAWTKSWQLDFSKLPENMNVFYSIVKDTVVVNPTIHRYCILDEEGKYLKRKDVFVCPYPDIKEGACERCWACYRDNPPEVLVLRRR
ncbi:GP88 family protein [Candidatus Caldatribacterium saccharofermentans]|uniref:GP88 family protein n=1 Tax=Candidatus Caldatribacterium saccharofermentans TaxID=1454753 RepID=UPI003D09548A